MKSIKEGINKYVSPVILLLVMVIAGCLVGSVFYLNDDIAMRSILSGAYTGTPDGHAVYMQYPLTGCLALLYRLLPIVPWLEIFFAACIWICMIFIADSLGKKWLGNLFSLVAFLPFFLYMHYTLVAAVVVATAIFLLARGNVYRKALFLLWIGYMIRSQIGWLCLPFVGAACVWQLLCNDGENRSGLKQVLAFAGKLLGGMAIITVIHHGCYSNAEWQEYLQYNEARTQLYDYTDFLSTDKYEKEYADYGMNYEEYQLLFHYNTMLDSTLDVEKLQTVAGKVTEGMNAENGLWKRLRSGVEKYYIQLRYHDFPYNYIWVGVFAFLGCCFLFKKKWLQVLYLGLLFVGRSSIWIYLLSQGRFPERVSISLYLLELLLLLGIGLSGVSIKKPIPRKGFVCASTVLIILLGMFLGRDTWQKVELQTQVQQEWNVLKNFSASNENTTYFMDVFSAVKYGDMLFAADNENIMMIGGWLSSSPLSTERLSKLGGQDGAEVMYYSENVRLVVASDREIAWMEEYFMKRFPDARLVQEQEVVHDKGSFLIYRLEK